MPLQYRHMVVSLLAAGLSLPGCVPGDSEPTDEEDDESEIASTGGALVVNTAVPYLKQRSYTGIGESACAPTSIAMILRYYYPNSNIDVREIYHAGLQAYSYSGPALGYRNLSWAGGDPGSSAIPAGFGNYYPSTGYSGARGVSYIQSYLSNIWGINSSVIDTEAALYTALAKGPVIGHVWAHGNTKWGHYLVVRGYDDKGTASHSDDVIYVNDPYDKWGNWDTSGENKAIPHKDFFVTGKYGTKWFRDAIALSPQDTSTQRQYTVVVDTGHNSVSGNSAHHLFQVDDMSDKVNGTTTYTWWMKYNTTGDYYFAKEAGHAARWTPKLAKTGKYDVAVKFLATPSGGNVTYRVYSSAGVELTSLVVNEHANTSQWSWAIVASSTSLSNGAYVRATEISADSSIDAVKFKYIGP